jgi:Homeodomain-like domain-containing protein
MRRMQLTTAAQEQLEHLFKTTNDRRLRDRCQAVLMASRRRKRQTIAQDLGGHRTTVQLWLKPYHERGVEGLQIQWALGQPRRLPETLVPTIQAWVKAGPTGSHGASPSCEAVPECRPAPPHSDSRAGRSPPALSEWRRPASRLPPDTPAGPEWSPGYRPRLSR